MQAPLKQNTQTVDVCSFRAWGRYHGKLVNDPLGLRRKGPVNKSITTRTRQKGVCESCLMIVVTAQQIRPTATPPYMYILLW